MTKPGPLTYIALFLAILFWGFSFVATKVALQSFPPFCLIFLRFIGASVFFVWLLARTEFPTMNRKNIVSLSLLALFQPGLYFTFETVGLQYTTATKTSLIIATIPIVVLLLSILFLKEKARTLQIAGILISMIGVALLVFGDGKGVPSGGALIGDLMITGAVLSAAIYMLISRHLGQTISPVQITGMQIIFGALIFAGPFLYQYPSIQWQSVTKEAIIAVVSLTVFATIGAFLCYNYALSNIPAASAAVCLNGIPLVTAIGAWLLLGETLSTLQMVGGAIVLGSVYLANHQKKSGKKKKAGVASKADFAS